MFRTALISMFLTSTALATTWTVDDDGKADFDNIQAAIDAASDGDEIVVMPGTYTGTGDYAVNMNGKAILLRSQNGAEDTIISGQGQRVVIHCGNNETASTIISGFKIIDGNSTFGGGNTMRDSCLIDCPDITGDGFVDVNDLLAIIDQWGLAGVPADINSDGVVDVSDLFIVVGNWGPCE